jgi:hypothetical protein
MTEDALTLGLWELQNDKYLLAEYTPIIKAAGYAPENTACLAGGDCYFLATAIMGAVKHRARVIPKGSFSETDYIGALKQMTSAELLEMRKRIDYRPQRKRVHVPRPKTR